MLLYNKGHRLLAPAEPNNSNVAEKYLLGSTWFLSEGSKTGILYDFSCLPPYIFPYSQYSLVENVIQNHTFSYFWLLLIVTHIDFW